MSGLAYFTFSVFSSLIHRKYFYFRDWSSSVLYIMKNFLCKTLLGFGQRNSCSLTNSIASRVSPAQYFQVPTTAPLSEVIANHLRKSIKEAQEIIGVGAVYYQSKRELQTDIAFELENLHLQRVLGDFIVAQGDAIRVYPSPRRHIPIFDTLVSRATNSSVAFSWENAILKETENYLIVNKPAGLPCHASAENFTDNILWLLQTHLSVRALRNSNNDLEENSYIHIISSEPITAPKLELYLPQRLDTDTSGLLLVIKSSEWISRLGKLLQQKKYRKWYKLVVAYQLPLAEYEQYFCSTQSTKLLNTFSVGDTLTSYLLKTDKTPKTYVWTKDGYDVDQLQDAMLKITDIQKPVVKTSNQWRDSYFQAKGNKSPSYMQSALAAWLQPISIQSQQQPSNNGNSSLILFQEITVELLTGRTHQIRGQFQALQTHPAILSSPLSCALQNCQIHIAGDHMYPGITFPMNMRSEVDADWTSPFLALSSYRFMLDIKPPRLQPHSLSETMKATSISAATKRKPLRKPKEMIEALDESLGDCWWSPLFQ